MNCMYVANGLNQYMGIVRGGVYERTAFDLDGNQTNVVTATGEWAVEYNGENRPVRWSLLIGGNLENPAEIRNLPKTIFMSYDRAGRRIARDDAYALYGGHLNITQTIWDPSEPIETRPLARIGDEHGTFLYFQDGNKNVASVVSSIDIKNINYTPFGLGGNRSEWGFSSEYLDSSIKAIYYNFRHYNPIIGRWVSRDSIEVLQGGGAYSFNVNDPENFTDHLGQCPVLLLYQERGLLLVSLWKLLRYQRRYHTL